MKYVKEFHSPLGSVQAIQLLPEEVSPSQEYLDELHEFMKLAEWASDRDGSVGIYQDGGYVFCPPSAWIVRDPDGTISVMEPEEFQKEFS